MLALGELSLPKLFAETSTAESVYPFSASPVVNFCPKLNLKLRPNRAFGMANRAWQPVVGLTDIRHQRDDRLRRGGEGRTGEQRQRQQDPDSGAPPGMRRGAGPPVGFRARIAGAEARPEGPARLVGSRGERCQDAALGRERAVSQVGRRRSHERKVGSARLGSARLGSARLGSARLGSARLGSRLGSAFLIILSPGAGGRSTPARTGARPAKARAGPPSPGAPSPPRPPRCRPPLPALPVPGSCPTFRTFAKTESPSPVSRFAFQWPRHPGRPSGRCRAAARRSSQVDP